MGITIQELLTQLSQRLQEGSETPLLDAQVLVAHQLDKPRTWILAHPDSPVTEVHYEAILKASDRLIKGEPLPYLVGHWEFYGLDFLVTPDVLIPRPETELLVERAIHWLQLHPHKRKVVDVGTGSGCIGLVIAKHVPDVHLIMADISPKALKVASRNAEKHGTLDGVEFIQADLLEGLPGTFDLICANLPYIPTQKLAQLRVAFNEPRLALDGGISGISVIERLLEGARGRLIAGGMMLLEIDASECKELQELAKRVYPQSRVEILKDLSGKDRMIEIERPNRIAHLCTPQEWLDNQRLSEFRDLSLVHDGFIHCSQPEQIIAVANQYYQASPEMMVLWIDPDRLASEIRWEPAGNIYYPHIYGPINLDAIYAATPLRPGRDGIYRHIDF